VKQLQCTLKAWIASLLLVVAAPAARAQEKPKVEFRDGDRIAFVGNDFFDGDRHQAYIETQFTTRFPGKHLTFRNLGYSGDTVRADARNLCAGWENFGPEDQGFDRLKSLLGHIKPTLIFVAYGMNESFDGPKGLDQFTQGLDRMLAMLAGTGARIVLISPIRHEDLGRPLPDPAEHNKNIVLYISAMEKMAQQHGYPFINLYEALGDGTRANPPGAFTSDGIHLTPYGYWRAAAALEQAMGYAPRDWTLELRPFGGKNSATGVTVDSVHADTGREGSKFKLTVDFTTAMLPLAPPPADAPKSVIEGGVVLPGEQRLIQIKGLSGGMRYVLKHADQTIVRADAAHLAAGVQIAASPDEIREERLRKLIIAKDFDFFNFWRPDNDTYIFGYRNHEQGRNAVEIPRFEPLVEEKEKQIRLLCIPCRHEYVLEQEGPR
jgi:lysophospholipase L1-like esterase